MNACLFHITSHFQDIGADISLKQDPSDSPKYLELGLKDTSQYLRIRTGRRMENTEPQICRPVTCMWKQRNVSDLLSKRE